MTEGFPLSTEQGFLHRLSGEGVQVEHKAWHSFTAVRAEKWVPGVVESRPSDFVVVQFGSTDVAMPLAVGLGLRSRGGLDSSPAKRPPVSPENRPIPNTGRATMVGWQIRGAVKWAARLQPSVNIDSYAAAMRRIAACIAESAVPVVLSPFVLGDEYSNAAARRHGLAVREALRSVPQAVFVDAWAALMKHPRRMVLLKDGFHLSARGHAVVAEAIREAVPALRGAPRNADEALSLS